MQKLTANSAELSPAPFLPIASPTRQRKRSDDGFCLRLRKLGLEGVLIQKETGKKTINNTEKEFWEEG